MTKANDLAWQRNLSCRWTSAWRSCHVSEPLHAQRMQMNCLTDELDGRRHHKHVQQTSRADKPFHTRSVPTTLLNGDTLKYKLKESVYHRRTQQVIQMFTYLLMHKLFSSCIRQYLVSHSCDWVMPALSLVLLTFSFQFSLPSFNISLNRSRHSHIYGSGPHQHCSVLLDNIRQQTLPKIWVGIFLVRSVQPRGKGKHWIYSNGKMKTRHPVAGPVSLKFPDICNRCGVMMASSRKT